MLASQRKAWFFPCIAVWAVSTLAAPARAYDPTHPKVQELALRGVAFLRSIDSNDAVSSSLGGRCLAAQAIYSVTQETNDPKIQLAMDTCRQAVASGRYGEPTNYHLGFAINFLAKVLKDEPDAKPLMAALWQALLARQRADGSWSYPNNKTGDTSQTQYAAFSMWEVHNYKVAEVPKSSVENLSKWLMRTQDPTGAWGYQGADPGPGGARQRQDEIRPSCVAAGAGSLFITADLLGQSKRGRKTEDANTLDSVAKKVETEKSRNELREGMRSTEVSSDRLRGALSDATNYIDRTYNIQTNRWQYYFMYGLERYHSFKDIVEGTEEKEPFWYNDGVEFLISAQEDDGGWLSKEHASSKGVDTSFAILFLMRSTKQALDVITREGQLRGGNGLPKDLTNLRLNDDGTLVAPTAEEQLKDLSDLLAEMSDREDLDENDFDPSMFVIKKEEKQSQFESLVQKVLGSEKYQDRLVGVRVLAAQRENLDQVPVLIYALSDPDPRVVIAARDALRLISKKIDGVGLPDNPQPEQIQAAQAAWKRWFLSIRPDAKFR